MINGIFKHILSILLFGFISRSARTRCLFGIALKQKNEGAHKFFIKQRELPGTKHILL